MVMRNLLGLLLFVVFGCESESGEQPFMIPEPTDTGSLEIDQGIDQTIEIDQAVLDMALPDQMIVDAMLLPQCQDGEDNDGDGQIDYPIDDGCESADDDSEEDQQLQACEDGLDNDSDGQIDYEDPGCANLDDPSETSTCGEPSLGFIDITGKTEFTGVTEGMSAMNTCRNNLAPELVFLYTIRDSPAAISFDTAGSGFDTLLGVYPACPSDSEPRACSDDISTADKTSEILIESPQVGDYFIVVDGHGNEAGNIVLNITRYDNDGEPCVTDEVGRACLEGRQCIEGICIPSLCSNGEDDDLDELIDFPNDPGCEQPSDESEEDPAIPTQCSDGADNDFDGQTDYPLDVNCESAGDDNESSPPVCADGVDNDNDGLIDLNDPGCRDNPEWFTESNPPACNNREDDDEDGFTDFPTDPGCLYPEDNDEVDPDLPSACRDGLDNDEDGLTDYPEDTDSCFYAADNNEDDPCARVTPIIADGSNRVRGTLTNGQNDFAGSCGGNNGNDQVFKYIVTPDQPLSNLIISASQSSFTPLVYVRSSCAADTEIQCQIAGQLNLGSQAPGTELWIYVDSFSPTTASYRLDITPVVEPGGNCAGSHHQCPTGLTCQRQAGQYRCGSAACNDGADNDDDGQTDFPFDPGCTSEEDTSEIDPLADPVCSNGFDDDGDGLIDFGEDPQCVSASDRDERSECSDGVDNDGDGRTDYDRDGDTTPDATRDFQCACEADSSEGTNPQCGDGCDNDNDGLIDLLDPGCETISDTSEINVPQCSDGIDNNADGVFDFPNDPGCPNTLTNIEQAPEITPVCSDGVDNDEDGLVDHASSSTNPDDGCHGAADVDERPYCEHAVNPLGLNGMVEGSTRTAPNLAISTCTSQSSGPEQIYRVEVPHPARVTARIYDTNFTSNLYLRSVCEVATPELGCRVFGGGSAGQLVTSQPAGDLFLFVDGMSGQAGEYKLDVEVLYELGNRCTNDERSHIKCADNRICQFNLQRGYPICQ